MPRRTADAHVDTMLWWDGCVEFSDLPKVTDSWYRFQCSKQFATELRPFSGLCTSSTPLILIKELILHLLRTGICNLFYLFYKNLN